MHNLYLVHKCIVFGIFRLYARGVDDEEKEYGVSHRYCSSKSFSSNRRGPAQNTNLHDSRGQDDIDHQFQLKLKKYVELSKSKTQFKHIPLTTCIRLDTFGEAG